MLRPAGFCVAFTDAGSLFCPAGSDSTVTVAQSSGKGLPPQQNYTFTSPTQPASEAPLPHALHLCPTLPPPLIPTPPIHHPHLYSITLTNPPYIFRLCRPLPFLPLSLSFCSSFREKQRMEAAMERGWGGAGQGPVNQRQGNGEKDGMKQCEM